MPTPRYLAMLERFGVSLGGLAGGPPRQPLPELAPLPPRASGRGGTGPRDAIVAKLRDAGHLDKQNPTDAEILAAVDAAKAARSAAPRPLSRAEILAGAAARVAAREEEAYRRIYPGTEQQPVSAADAAEAEYRRFYPKG